MRAGAHLDVVAAGGDAAVGVVRVPGARPQLRQLASRLGACHLRTATDRMNGLWAGKSSTAT